MSRRELSPEQENPAAKDMRRSGGTVVVLVLVSALVTGIALGAGGIGPMARMVRGVLSPPAASSTGVGSSTSAELDAGVATGSATSATSSSSSADLTSSPAPSSAAVSAVSEEEGTTVDGEDATEPSHDSYTNLDALARLVPLEPRNDETIAKARKLLNHRRLHASQGNPVASWHRVNRKQCLDGLKGVVIQTKDQKDVCGSTNMVPIHRGNVEEATSCIDVFEYPNKACTLPFVFTHAIQAEDLCELAGKRLCTQQEWNTACEASPRGEPPTKYAYGDEMDLSICNTGKTKLPKDIPYCRIEEDLWGTCGSHTEPAGAFPKCRSRLGVYDLHGNVAEAMTRYEHRAINKDNKAVDFVQLKGSAFFYDGKVYDDSCRFDPRWHVDPLNESWHANYHLGFRCCKDVEPRAFRKK